MSKICVHDDFVSEELAFAGANTLDGFAVHDDRFHGLVHAEGDAEIFGDAGHTLAHTAQAANGVEDAVLVFEEGQHGEQAGAVEGRHTEVLRLEGHGQHQTVVVKEFHQVPCHRALRPKHTCDAHGSLGEQVGGTVPRLLQAGLRFVEFHSVVRHVTAEGVGVVVAGECSDALGHLIEVARAVELTALSENEPVIQVELVEVEFVMGVQTDGLEDVLDHFGVVEEGRAEVEFEPVPVEDFVASTHGAGAFEHGDVDTGFCKQEGGGQSAGTRADDGHFWLRTSSHGPRCGCGHINDGFCS